MARKLEEVQAEYNNQCAILGDLHYKMSIAKADERAMLRKLKHLNIEAKQAAIEAEQAKEASDESKAE